jgi:hypothetical protein
VQGYASFGTRKRGTVSVEPAATSVAASRAAHRATRAAADLITELLRQHAEAVTLLAHLDVTVTPLTMTVVQRQRHDLEAYLAAARRLLPRAHRIVLS